MWYADGKSKKQIKDDMLEFLSKYAPDLSLPRWEPAIERQLKLLNRYPLIELDGIGITQGEIDTIRSLYGRMHRRLAFALLCISKFKNIVNPNNNDWVGVGDKEIFKLANIQKNIVGQSALFRDLRDAGLIQFSKIVDNLNVRVMFMDKEALAVHMVDDFRNLGNQFHAIEGGSFVKCQECGLWVRQNKWNNRKYCPECAKYKPIGDKFITCADCGKEFKVNSKANNRKRCDDCAALKIRSQWRESKSNSKGQF